MRILQLRVVLRNETTQKALTQKFSLSGRFDPYRQWMSGTSIAISIMCAYSRGFFSVCSTPLLIIYRYAVRVGVGVRSLSQKIYFE